MIFRKHATKAEKEIFSNLMWVHTSVSTYIYQHDDIESIDILIKLTDRMARMAEEKPDIYQTEPESDDEQGASDSQDSEADNKSPFDRLIDSLSNLGEAFKTASGGGSDDPAQ